ncbi:uncharacterized protein BP01DRAFT_355418 [Aspergillus saccharolyticus JOP 1030-1]|uniref:Uncharacterized protein n=1 Tax=Aspergillus saccharolyticus JOP 1030-1 TaxID=1450539 RepID=A0A318ZJ53_9EURO|nr:hypothetical protein BP01DRAFT_355418 [Aspergillus saccharolyticus JOP 1030-1]PYH46384.1 hypothetical protein BP01DRAFT_355418 [Aspergillus saccharolyticus JOP 1030-1]
MLGSIIHHLRDIFTKHTEDRFSVMCSSVTTIRDIPHVYGQEALDQLLYIDKYLGIGYGPNDEPYLKLVGCYGQPPERRRTHWSRSFFNQWSLPRSMLSYLVPVDEQEYMEKRYGFNWSRVTVEARLISIPTCRAHWTMTLAEKGRSLNISYEIGGHRYYEDSIYRNFNALAVFEADNCSVYKLSEHVWIPEHTKQTDTCSCVDWFFLNLFRFSVNGFLSLGDGRGKDLFNFLQQKRYEVVGSSGSWI